MVWEGVHRAPEIAASREAQRPDRAEGMALAQVLSVHNGVIYDFEADTMNRRPTSRREVNMPTLDVSVITRT